jgi:hypothetical protein
MLMCLMDVYQVCFRYKDSVKASTHGTNFRKISNHEMFFRPCFRNIFQLIKFTETFYYP